MDESIDESSQPQTPGVELAPGVFAPLGTVRLQYARAGGPGGQNVNKVNTKAELWVAVEPLVGLSPAAKARLRSLAGSRLTKNDELHLAGETERSQEANRAAVFQRLRELILRARVEPKIRRRTRPTRAAKQRRLEQKRRRGQVKSHRRGRVSDD